MSEEQFCREKRWFDIHSIDINDVDKDRIREIISEWTAILDDERYERLQFWIDGDLYMEGYRLETVEEFEERMVDNQRQEDLDKTRELRELKRLFEKHGNPNMIDEEPIDTIP